MAVVREENLNVCLAGILDESPLIVATAEMLSSNEAVDITVKHPGSKVSLLMEAKINDTKANRRAATKQARDRLETRPSALAFAVCYPKSLLDELEAIEELGQTDIKHSLRSSELTFAPVQRTGTPVWRLGSVSDLGDMLLSAELSKPGIVDSIEHAVRTAAELVHLAGCSLNIAKALALPSKSPKDFKAAALVGSLMLSNASLLHRRLRLVPALASISPIEAAVKQENPITALQLAWEAILAIDYHPVFSPALAVLRALEDDNDTQNAILFVANNAIATADDLASLRFDHAGPLYHRLLASAKFDGSFYTHNVSALLLARMALPKDALDWKNLDSLMGLRVVDPACGTGTLLMAVMHAIRDRQSQYGAENGDAASLLHLALVEDILYGLDINRHGIQLAACNLTLGNPRVDYSRMNLFTMKHGPETRRKTRAGSIELLATAKSEMDLTNFVSPLPTMEELQAERAQTGGMSEESMRNAFDLVIMNPPFTRNDIRNRQYGKAARKAVQKREIEIADFLQRVDKPAFLAIDQTSIETFFAPLSDYLLKEDRGTLAMVMPTTALTGASVANKRKFLASHFDIEIIVTSHDPSRVNFSENTDIHESLMIARRHRGGDRRPTRFISLAKMPQDAHDAMVLSDIINDHQELGDWGNEHSWPWPFIREGNWSVGQFFDGRLAEAVRDLEALAGSLLAPAARLCTIAPGGQRIRDAFLRDNSGDKRLKVPILWDHVTDVQRSMTAAADVIGTPKKAKFDYASNRLVPKASKLLIANRLRMDTARISSCYADEPLLGSAWIPVRPHQENEGFEKALCVWWNSTPGIY